MKFTLTLAVLAAVTLAKKHKKETDDFIRYAHKETKNYKNVEEFKKRMDQFTKNHNYVEFLNEEALSKNWRVHFVDNFTSDMDDDEYEKMLGLVVPEGGLGASSGPLLQDIVEPKGRSLQSDYDVDWVTEGRMHPVKQQFCGDCWAFAAATVQEGRQAIKDNTSAVRISEQQAVDCNTGESSCVGGWMEDAWNYWRSHGAMSNAEYPYTAKDGTCKTVSNASISNTGRQTSLGTTYENDSYKFHTQQVIDQLQNGPVGAYVNFSDECWRFSDGKIITEKMGCPTDHNHAVTIVAYTAAVEGFGGESKLVNTCTPESSEKICFEESFYSVCPNYYQTCTNQSVMKSCRRTKRAERRAKECNDDSVFTKYRFAKKKCCYFEYVETCITPFFDDMCRFTNRTCNKPADVETCKTTDFVGPIPPSTPAYWTIQNSWGSGWGENGFVRVEVTDSGVGVSGVNQIIQWITVE